MTDQQKGGVHQWGSLLDHNESYGRHVISEFLGLIPPPRQAADLGAGPGLDLELVKTAYPNCVTTAIECRPMWQDILRKVADNVVALDIEREALPLASASIDLMMANQILEHTKEVFWIFDQISRALSVGGHFILGVPNIASLHNRLLMLAGFQPTQHKLASAHVRPFSKRDTLRFLEACFPGGYSLTAFAGAQFYPFPKQPARALARAFPTMAFSIFFLLRKEREYAGEFLAYPERVGLETNFWRGGQADFMTVAR